MVLTIDAAQVASCEKNGARAAPVIIIRITIRAVISALEFRLLPKVERGTRDPALAALSAESDLSLCPVHPASARTEHAFFIPLAAISTLHRIDPFLQIFDAFQISHPWPVHRFSYIIAIPDVLFHDI